MGLLEKVSHGDIVQLIDRYNPVTERVLHASYIRQQYAKEFKMRHFDSVSEIIIQLRKDKLACQRFYGLPPLESHHLPLEAQAKKDFNDMALSVVATSLALIYVALVAFTGF